MRMAAPATGIGQLLTLLLYVAVYLKTDMPVRLRREHIGFDAKLDGKLYAIGKTALRIICIGFVVSAVSTTSSGALEGLGKGTQSLVISLCRYIVFIMPLAWGLCRLAGPTGVWHAFWITEVLTAGIAYAVYRKSAAPPERE